MLMQKHTKINFSELKCAFPFDINLPLSTDEAVSKVHFINLATKTQSFVFQFFFSSSLRAFVAKPDFCDGLIFFTFFPCNRITLSLSSYTLK